MKFIDLNIKIYKLHVMFYVMYNLFVQQAAFEKSATV
jgi:hypothetical protein